MQTWKKLHILHALLIINLFFPTYIAHQINTPTFCGKIKLQTPFIRQNTTKTSLLNHMVLCKSHKLYFRTSLGLFPISSIDYTTKLLTISHNSRSSSLNFISPSHFSAGFLSPPQPNSLFLFNCSKTHSYSQVLRNCPGFEGRKAASLCLFVEDAEKLEVGFHPKELNCSSYSRVYRRSDVSVEKMEGYELGTRVSFDIPNHVPNPCDECVKPHGNCGVGLKCICHPKECKDKVISIGVKEKPLVKILFYLLPLIVVRDLLMGS